METEKTREALTDEERTRFEGHAAAIFSRMGMDLDFSERTRNATEMADGAMGYDRE